jgi:hypothetical protein
MGPPRSLRGSFTSRVNNTRKQQWLSMLQRQQQLSLQMTFSQSLPCESAEL